MPHRSGFGQRIHRADWCVGRAENTLTIRTEIHRLLFNVRESFPRKRNGFWSSTGRKEPIQINRPVGNLTTKKFGCCGTGQEVQEVHAANFLFSRNAAAAGVNGQSDRSVAMTTGSEPGWLRLWTRLIKEVM